MYVRVTQKVFQKGMLVRPEEVAKKITNRKSDWYQSPFVYEDEVMEYWKAHGKSINGYKGRAFTKSLYWDLDCEGNYKKVRSASLKLVKKLLSMGFSEDSIEIFFSGKKGLHIFAHTKDKFTPEETSAICYNLAAEAELPLDIIDTSVYNLNRIFRIPNTRHQESKLYKISLKLKELKEWSEDQVRSKARRPRELEFKAKPVEIRSKLKSYIEKIERVEKAGKEVSLDGPASSIDFSTCPNDMRKCVWALEQGHFGPGERHNAIVRLAAYYKSKGQDYDFASHMIYDALEKRSKLFPDASEPKEAEVERDIQEVFSEKWKGGAFTCKKDAYLRSKCDHGDGPCASKKAAHSTNVIGIEQVIRNYVQFGLASKGEYPKTGIKWIDDRVRLRPKDFSILGGAPGSGKTSLVIKFLENFNSQKLRHIFFSLDMSENSIVEKLGAKYTNYSQRQIEKAFSADEEHRNPQIQKEVIEALRMQLPYTSFDFTSSASVEYLEQAVADTEEILKEKVKICVIDFAGRIPGDLPSQHANATANANAINDLSKKLNTHFLVLSQVSRENGDHTDPLRSSRVSKDSGAWEENASVILTCWRPFGNGLEGKDEFMHIYISKNRTGPLGERVLGWEGRRGEIFELSDQDFAKYAQHFERAKEGDQIFDSRIRAGHNRDEEVDYHFLASEIKYKK